MNKLTDNSSDRSYFTIVPRVVLATCPTPYHLALWLTVKDIAGEDGTCVLSTPKLATLAGMSAGKCSQVRKELLSLKLLEGELVKDSGYPMEVWHLSIPDLWARNIAFVKRHPSLKDRIRLKEEATSATILSPGERGLSPHERPPSPHERKKILKEEPKEEPRLVAVGEEFEDGHSEPEQRELEQLLQLRFKLRGRMSKGQRKRLLKPVTVPDPERPASLKELPCPADLYDTDPLFRAYVEEGIQWALSDHGTPRSLGARRNACIGWIRNYEREPNGWLAFKRNQLEEEKSTERETIDATANSYAAQVARFLNE